jgi:hypothetical protein
MKKRAIRHGLADAGRVRASIDQAVKANAARLAPYSPQMAWKDERAAALSVTVMAKTIRADFTITDDEVLLEGEIPFLFSHLEERIMGRLGEHLEEAFARARAERT